MLTRNLDKARKAYASKDAKASQEAHSIFAPEQHQKEGKHIKSIIYGGLDGTITTFAVVAGVAGANLSSGITLIMGFANLIGDGISMAIGDYLSTKSEQEYQKKERERETWELENYPEGEKTEMQQIYEEKGLLKSDAQKVVGAMSTNKKAFVDIMMVEELSIFESKENPLKNALATFISFITFGFVPLLIFVLGTLFGFQGAFFLFASILTGLTLFSLGALKTKFTGRNWFTSGLEMLLVGSLAACAAYVIGFLLRGLG
jgi:vacuolar iron transporter family protein